MVKCDPARLGRLARRAIKEAGGPSFVADELGIRIPSVYTWMKTGVPANRVGEVQELTSWTPSKIRPDLFPPCRHCGR